MPFATCMTLLQWARLRAVFAALLFILGLSCEPGSVHAANPTATPPSAPDLREMELSRAFVQALALSERGYESLAELLLSTERRFKRRREALHSALDAFRAINARCEVLEEESAMHSTTANDRALELCANDLTKAASRVTSFPQQEPALLKATHTVYERYGGCEVQKKEAEATPAKKAAYDLCLTELSATISRIRNTYPNLEWLEKR